jgi:hypothetical protein
MVGNGLLGVNTFKAGDYSSGTNFKKTWFGRINCFEGTLDFRKGIKLSGTFSAGATQPPSTGTPVRNGTSALAGIWINPNPCP